MRIQAKDLNQQLAKGLSSTYLVFGDEPYQNHIAVQCIREAVKQQGFTEHTRFDISPQFEWDHFKEALNTLSLFSAKKMIECHVPEGKVGKKGSEALINFAKTGSKDTVLLIICGKLDNTVLQSVWFTHLEKNGLVIQARPLYKEETLQWLGQQLKNAKFPVQNEILHLLYERTEGNLLAAAQAIEKLQLYYEKSHSSAQISLEDITSILADSTRFTAFDLVDAVLERSLIRTNRILMSLKNEGVEPLFILWAMTREVRTISHFCFDIANGLSVTKVLDNANLWKNKKELMHRYFKQFTLPISTLQKQLHQSLITAKHIDDIIKGRTSGHVWQSLHFLCCMVMGVSGVQYA